LKVSALTLWMLPILQVLFFAGCVYYFPLTPSGSFVLLLLAAFLLSLSLHVTYHEVAHHCREWGQPIAVMAGLLLSILMGVSFQAYRIGHFNHHRYNNGIEDFTSTWKQQGESYAPRNLLFYCLSWPRAYLQFPALVKKAMIDSDADSTALLRCLIESGLLTGVIIFLFYYDSTVALLYLALVYFGWALISLHNYGQHIPVGYGAFPATSYAAGWYNRLLFKNGLHYEHHLNPAVPIAELAVDSSAPLVRWPHFILPLVSAAKYFERKDS